jgi:hypothetical protein
VDKGIILSEKDQSPKFSPYMMLLMNRIHNDKIAEVEKKLVVARGQERGWED